MYVDFVTSKDVNYSLILCLLFFILHDSGKNASIFSSVSIPDHRNS